MNSSDKQIQDFIKFLKKLLMIIENESKFIFGSKRLVETKRLDDVFCCIEGSWPEIYKKFLQTQGDLNLRSPFLYKNLKKATKNKFLLSTKYCVVYYPEVVNTIRKLMTSIETDVRYIENIN